MSYICKYVSLESTKETSSVQSIKVTSEVENAMDTGDSERGMHGQILVHCIMASWLYQNMPWRMSGRF